MTAADFSDDELAVINALTEAWNRFVGLPVRHPDDSDEFRRAIHAAQRLILVRPQLLPDRYGIHSPTCRLEPDCNCGAASKA
jgi:hypothetical protein